MVLTDGASNTGTSVSEAAKIARDKSIKIHAFGIGNRINETELLEIAGSLDRVHMIDSFDNINDAKALISEGFYLGKKQYVAIMHVYRCMTCIALLIYVCLLDWCVYTHVCMGMCTYNMFTWVCTFVLMWSIYFM